MRVLTWAAVSGKIDSCERRGSQRRKFQILQCLRTTRYQVPSPMLLCLQTTRYQVSSPMLWCLQTTRHQVPSPMLRCLRTTRYQVPIPTLQSLWTTLLRCLRTTRYQVSSPTLQCLRTTKYQVPSPMLQCSRTTRNQVPTLFGWEPGRKSYKNGNDTMNRGNPRSTRSQPWLNRSWLGKTYHITSSIESVERHNEPSSITIQSQPKNSEKYVRNMFSVVSFSSSTSNLIVSLVGWPWVLVFCRCSMILLHFIKSFQQPQLWVRQIMVDTHLCTLRSAPAARF